MSFLSFRCRGRGTKTRDHVRCCQVMRQLQELAAGQELRFEVSRDAALCFEVIHQQSVCRKTSGSACSHCHPVSLEA